MATILKYHNKKSKGVISITNLEYKYFKNEILDILKKKRF